MFSNDVFDFDQKASLSLLFECRLQATVIARFADSKHFAHLLDGPLIPSFTEVRIELARLCRIRSFAKKTSAYLRIFIGSAQLIYFSSYEIK